MFLLSTIPVFLSKSLTSFQYMQCFSAFVGKNPYNKRNRDDNITNTHPLIAPFIILYLPSNQIDICIK